MVWLWKESTVEVLLVQYLRVSCEHCHKPFLAFATHEFTKTEKGMPYVSLISGAEERNIALGRAIAEEIAFKVPLKPPKTSCPSCRYPYPLPQEIHRHSTRRTLLRNWSIAGLILGVLVGGLAFWLSSGTAIPFVVGAIVVSTSLGVLVGMRDPVDFDVVPEPRPKTEGEDPLSFPDQPFAFPNATEERSQTPSEAAVLVNGLKRGLLPSKYMFHGSGIALIPLPVYDAVDGPGEDFRARVGQILGDLAPQVQCGRCGVELFQQWQKCHRCNASFDEFPPVIRSSSSVIWEGKQKVLGSRPTEEKDA